MSLNRQDEKIGEHQRHCVLLSSSIEQFATSKYEFKSSTTVPTLSLSLQKYSVLLAFPAVGLTHIYEISNYLITMETRATVNASIEGSFVILLFSLFWGDC